MTHFASFRHTTASRFAISLSTQSAVCPNIENIKRYSYEGRCYSLINGANVGVDTSEAEF